MAEVPFDNLKPNSHKSKEEQNPPKRVKGSVVKGSVMDRNKTGAMRWWRMIFEEDVSSVVKYLGQDVLVPKIKDTIYDLITTGLSRSIYHDDRKVSNRSTGERTSYTTFYASSGKSTTRQKDVEIEEKQELDYKNMLFADRSDVETVIKNMKDAIDIYHQVTVGDLYDLVGKTGAFTDHKYGWTEKDVHLFGVRRVRNGYLLVVPTAYALD